MTIIYTLGSAIAFIAYVGRYAGYPASTVVGNDDGHGIKDVVVDFRVNAVIVDEPVRQHFECVSQKTNPFIECLIVGQLWKPIVIVILDVLINRLNFIFLTDDSP